MRKKYSLHQALASDECSDTASTTNGSDLETTLSCTDDMVAPIQPELLKSLVEQEKHLECGSADNENDKVDPRDSVTGVSKQNFDRAITDDTTRLDEDELSIIESSKYSILVDNVQQEPILELKVSQLTNKSYTINSNQKSLSNHVMLSELDQIESKIKAAIHHNRQVHSNSIELESVIRQSLSGHPPAASVDAAPIPSELFAMKSAELESLGNPEVDFVTSSSAVSLGSSRSDVEAQNENQLLKKQMADMKQELSKLNEARLQDKYQYETSIQKLKKELRSAKRLTHKLQTKKLNEMESNFAASLHLLEAKFSEDLNNDLEQQLDLVKQERDTARELNLPLFNNLKKLYEIKAALQKKIDELSKSQEIQKGVQKALEGNVNELLQVKEDLLEKARIDNKKVVGMANEVLLAHEEISRLKSEILYLKEEKALKVNDIKVKISKHENVSIQQLWEDNQHLSKRDEWTRLQSEEQDLRWKLEALDASMKLQLKEKDEQILELEKKLKLG